MTQWTPRDSQSLYNVSNWSSGYFGINDDGNVVARPDDSNGAPSREIDLFQLIGQIRRRGLETPILLRFDGILRARVRELNRAFTAAREEYDYAAPYATVFPIKVNQQRHLVEALLEEGDRHGIGLEVGSKPELLAVLGLFATPGRLLICNGYKDSEYIETALLTMRLGVKPIIVIEKYSELETVLQVAGELKIRPILGVRTKLGGRGAGRWKDSGGDSSKFGLTTRQIVKVAEELEASGMIDCLQLLHFHLGSQITRIRSIKNALGEATRTFVGLHEMGAPIRWFDVGGGLGVDYDGSKTDFESSMNYSVQEYANDIVFQIRQACEEAELPLPTILSESGRALTAHHAVLVTEVLGVSDFNTVGVPERAGPDEADMIKDFAEICENVNAKNFQESYHDALELRDRGMTLFNVGQVSLVERARIEEFFWRTCQKILRLTRTLTYVPDDLEHLERDMADTYFLNFSVFQSMPDSWAIQQLFPVLPLHRHGEKPTRKAVLADITCDSDGKVDRFIDLRDVKRTLDLHPVKEGERYYVGFFMVGAYQEILGDLHNLFGDTHVVHVDIGDDGRPQLKHFITGDMTEEVLSYVEYFKGDMIASLRRRVEEAIAEDRITFEESGLLLKRLEQGLASYTYLNTPESLEATAESTDSPSTT